MISFADISFLFRFLPVFLVVYYLVPAKYKEYVLILGSLIFYALGEGFFVLLLILLILVNYSFAAWSFRVKTHKGQEHIDKVKKICMISAIEINILVLLTFKGLAVFKDNSLLPLGLSFYIFKMISFQADVYNRKIDRSLTLSQAAAYFSLFPQIAQGPIMRFSDGDFGYEKIITREKIEEGLRYFIIGFAMKVILADRIGILWNDIKMYGYQSISTPLAWMGAFAYTFELYFDFWGYSLMASGIMVALGFDFIRNFEHPYASKTISEFYRRWHMTLGSFFRDYVYFPMGGSRCSKPRMCLNLMVVWVLTGLWHGNGFNFLIWGAVLGILIVAEKLLYGKKLEEIPVLGNVYTVIIICLTWVIFAINNLGDLGIFFGRLFPFFGSSGVVNTSDIFEYIADYWWMFVISIVLCVPAIGKLYEKHKKSPVVTVLLLVLFWISVYFSVSTKGNPFMYLHF
ncbi:MAG: MBOAT family protein [Lachnospiraceae bacterium]|nr:MBOAT family protein [Lachnospiraceae bacterium]